MAATLDPASQSQLAKTLGVRRAARRQAACLAILVTGAVVWRLSPLAEPEPVTILVILLGSALLAIDLTISWWEGGEADFQADQLILLGYATMHSSTPIGRAVARRLAHVETQAARRELADALRWRIKLATGRTRPSPGYVRASVLPPLSPAQRLVFQQDSDMISALADRIERGEADPKALIILERLITLPAVPAPGTALTVLTEDVRRTFLHARTLIDAGP